MEVHLRSHAAHACHLAPQRQPGDVARCLDDQGHRVLQARVVRGGDEVQRREARRGWLGSEGARSNREPERALLHLIIVRGYGMPTNHIRARREMRGQDLHHVVLLHTGVNAARPDLLLMSIKKFQGAPFDSQLIVEPGADDRWSLRERSAVGRRRLDQCGVAPRRGSGPGQDESEQQTYCCDPEDIHLRPPPKESRLMGNLQDMAVRPTPVSPRLYHSCGRQNNVSKVVETLSRLWPRMGTPDKRLPPRTSPRRRRERRTTSRRGGNLIWHSPRACGQQRFWRSWGWGSPWPVLPRPMSAARWERM